MKVKVKIIKEYNDLELKRLVTPKDGVLEVTEERANKLIKAGVAEAVETKEPAEETPAEAPKKKAPKKKEA